MTENSSVIWARTFPRPKKPLPKITRHAPKYDFSRIAPRMSWRDWLLDVALVAFCLAGVAAATAAGCGVWVALKALVG